MCRHGRIPSAELDNVDEYESVFSSSELSLLASGGSRGVSSEA